QKYFAPRVLDQPLAELDELIGTKASVEYHEAHLPLVGQRRDHIAAKALARYAHHRGLPHRREAATANIVGAKSSLIAPVDRGLVALGDRLIVAIVGAFDWPLRTQSPARQISAHRTKRQVHLALTLDQALHGSPRPKVKRQLQLIGH